MQISHTCYVVKAHSDIPKHLKTRPVEVFEDVGISYKVPKSDAVGPEGEVLRASVVEFQTYITPTRLVQVCNPRDLWSPRCIGSTRFSVVFDPEISRGETETKKGKAQVLNEKTKEGFKEDLRNNVLRMPNLEWNLRYPLVLWVYVVEERKLLVYEGVATRPDSNHRHWAIDEVHQEYKEWLYQTGDKKFREYNPEAQYGLTIRTADRAEEATDFSKWNTQGTKATPSKAYHVSAMGIDPNPHAKLASQLMRMHGILGDKNVELSSTSLSKNSAKLVLFYTLVRGLNLAFPTIPTEQEAYDDLRGYLLDFLTELNGVRPEEIALLSLERRQQVREESIADQAITWIAYFGLAAALRSVKGWKSKLDALRQPVSIDEYTGDLFSRKNPLWVKKGILIQNQEGKFRVVANRASQQEMIKALKDIVLSPAKT